MADRARRRRCDTTLERRILAASIDRDSSETMPCSYCWNASPRKRYIMSGNLRRCSNCVCKGKSCNSSNIANSLILNWQEQDKIEKEISKAEDLL
ncbi:hypothetical protein VTK56DRAFT_4336 [Thermocarpiscus australiensis]